MILSVPNGSNVRSNHNIDMTTTNTSMFGILFEVGLLIICTPFKTSTFVDKTLFIHISNKPNLI